MKFVKHSFSKKFWAALLIVVVGVGVSAAVLYWQDQTSLKVTLVKWEIDPARIAYPGHMRVVLYFRFDNGLTFSRYGNERMYIRFNISVKRANGTGIIVPLGGLAAGSGLDFIFSNGTVIDLEKFLNTPTFTGWNPINCNHGGGNSSSAIFDMKVNLFCLALWKEWASIPRGMIISGYVGVPLSEGYRSDDIVTVTYIRFDYYRS